MFEPKVSLGLGLAVATVVYAIHSNFTPTMADMQGLPAGNKDVDKAERKATWISAGVVSGISLLAKDPTVFVIGSAMTIVLAFTTRHAVWTESAAGPAISSPGSMVSANDMSTAALPASTQDYTMFSQNRSEFVSS